MAPLVRWCHDPTIRRFMTTMTINMPDGLTRKCQITKAVASHRKPKLKTCRLRCHVRCANFLIISTKSRPQTAYNYRLWLSELHPWMPLRTRLQLCWSAGHCGLAPSCTGIKSSAVQSWTTLSSYCRRRILSIFPEAHLRRLLDITRR